MTETTNNIHKVTPMISIRMCRGTSPADGLTAMLAACGREGSWSSRTSWGCIEDLLKKTRGLRSEISGATFIERGVGRKRNQDGHRTVNPGPVLTIDFRSLRRFRGNLDRFG